MFNLLNEYVKLVVEVSDDHVIDKIVDDMLNDVWLMHQNAIDLDARHVLASLNMHVAKFREAAPKNKTMFRHRYRKQALADMRYDLEELKGIYGEQHEPTEEEFRVWPKFLESFEPLLRQLEDLI